MSFATFYCSCGKEVTGFISGRMVCFDCAELIKEFDNEPDPGDLLDQKADEQFHALRDEGKI